MQKITAAETLKQSILVLECKQIEDRKLLADQFSAAYESLKPINVLRKMIKEIASPSKLKDDLIQTGIGLISGYLSRKMLVRSSKNPFLRLAGIFVQSGVMNFVANNSTSIKAMGLQVINIVTCNPREHKN